jgi:hypothetical protein
MKYRIAFRSPLSGEVHYFRKEYTDLIGVQSAVDDYKIGEPETEFWYEPVDEPSPVSNVEITISQTPLIIR